MTEQIDSNGVSGAPLISVCIPAWRDTAGPLLTSLATLAGPDLCEILVYDDGSGAPDMTAQIRHSLAHIKAPASLITAATNHGRSHARNRLMAHAKADWLLLLDADMLPDEVNFLQQYHQEIIAHPAPALVCGGFSLNQVQANPKQRLHAAQSLLSECLPASVRAREPGLHVFTSNILVHRNILQTIRFDEAYQGWGWEDVDWGLRVAADFPVRHIDNTATHLGLDDAASLLSKYAGSGENFARLVRAHPEEAAAMRLYQVSKRLSGMPARRLIGSLTKTLARDPLGLVPMRIRLFALKLFRATLYAEAFR